MKPKVGRIVHYIADGRHCAAIITRVWNDLCVNLCVFERYTNVASVIYTSVMYMDPSEAGEDIDATWHWPERE